MKIGATKKEKAQKKQWLKQLRSIGTIETDANGKEVSKRNEDLFIGGPSWIDGFTCAHQPNGPRATNDPKGFWADYLIKDTLVIDGSKHVGYHIYSPVRGIFMNEEGKVLQGQAPQFGMGTRGPNYRKCYYYIGWLEEGLIRREGYAFEEFTGILSASN